MKKKRKKPALPVIGWREWVGLPELGIRTIKAKVDTGARSSSLHAYDVEEFRRGRHLWVRFKVHPKQRSSKPVVEAEAKVLEHRRVRSSSGKASIRPVIVTRVSLLGVSWPVELTLANRDAMGFRMLLGREAFRRRFLVDAGSSYYGGQPARKVAKGKVAKRKVAKAKVAKAKVAKRKVAKAKVAKRKFAKGKVAKRKVAKRERR